MLFKFKKKPANMTIIIISLISLLFITLNIQNYKNIEVSEKNKIQRDISKVDNMIENIKKNIEIFYNMNYKMFHKTETLGSSGDLNKYYYITFDGKSQTYQYYRTTDENIGYEDLDSFISFAHSPTSNTRLYFLKKLAIDSLIVQKKYTMNIEGRTTVYPIIKMSPVMPFELSINSNVPIFYFSLLIPQNQNQNLNEEIDSNHISVSVNTRKILYKKEKEIIDIMDEFSIFLIGKQELLNYDNIYNKNYISAMGSTILACNTPGENPCTRFKTYGRNLNVNLNLNQKTELNFLNTNGFLLLKSSEVYSSSDLDDTALTSNIFPGSTSMRLNSTYSKITSTADTSFGQDYYLFDFRGEFESLSTTNYIENIFDIETDLGTIDDYRSSSLNSFFSTYTQEEIENTEIFCSLNDNCGLRYTIVQDGTANDKRISSIDTIKVYEYFEDELGKDDIFIELNNKKWLKRNNPFYIQDTHVGELNTDIFIDVSSSTSYKTKTFNNPDNVIIYTIGLRKGQKGSDYSSSSFDDNDINRNCDKCQEGSKMFSKRYIRLKG